jgi:hypothetical protein
VAARRCLLLYGESVCESPRELLLYSCLPFLLPVNGKW